MFSTAPHRPKLTAHKEGKLKSYESCLDVRGWSHDGDRKSSYLRDWIRGDIPACVLPVHAITRLLKTMTKKRRGSLAPPCGPDCRSKIILDNIYTSCHAIRECLRTDGELHKFFEDEEFETSNWPCERCVEILKSIKLFWNIILEKLVKITFPTNEEFDTAKAKSIDQFAKEWKDEIVEQTLQVKHLQSVKSNRMGINIKDSHNSNNANYRHCKKYNDLNYNALQRGRRRCKDAATNTDYSLGREAVKQATKSQYVCASIKKSDISCNTSFKSLTYLSKKDLLYLQKRLDMQESKIKRLQNENDSLRLKLKNKTEDVSYDVSNNISDSNTNTVDSYSKDHFETLKDIASEMIITLKNCTNKSYRNISVLQVLHKSNVTSGHTNDNILDEKNPIDVLNRVHDTFSAIVRREICIARDNKNYRVDKMKTSYHEADSTSISKSSSNSTATRYESVERL